MARATSPEATGHLILSVDLEPAEVVTRTGVLRETQALGSRLIRRCNERGLAATWAIAEPGLSKHLASLVGSPLAHEIAILGESDWLGQGISRQEFTRELQRRLGHAQAAGVSVSTLAPRDGVVDDHLDVVVKSGITALRGCVDAAVRAKRPAAAHRLHFGMWEVPGSARLPYADGWVSSRFHLKRIFRRLEHVAARAGSLHLVIDVARTAQAGPAAERRVVAVLRRIHQLCSRRQLVVETMRDTVERLLMASQSTPQRSILRLVS